MPQWDWGAAGPPDTSAAAAQDEQEPVTLPGPDEAVSFASHIRPLLREHDRQSMIFAFGL